MYISSLYFVCTTFLQPIILSKNDRKLTSATSLHESAADIDSPERSQPFQKKRKAMNEAGTSAEFREALQDNSSVTSPVP